MKEEGRMKSNWWYCSLVLLLFCAVSVYAEGFEPTDNEDKNTVVGE
ncbi:MAG: hypothetical protein ACREX3_01460 [Gammaproteobacteria bacterium]